MRDHSKYSFLKNRRKQLRVGGYIDFTVDAGAFALWKVDRNGVVVYAEHPDLDHLLRLLMKSIRPAAPRFRSFLGIVVSVIVLLLLLSASLVLRARVMGDCFIEECSWRSSDSGGGAIVAKLQAIS